MIMKNKLFYGDNLELMRQYIKDESIDLCYIDPPFNSKRNYFQIYKGLNEPEDRAQAEAFTDTWTWGEAAEQTHHDILSNKGNYTPQTIELLNGLLSILGKNGLFAYLISMTARLNEIHRCLKENGSFYLHCDPTASHYLKLILDSIYIPRGGDFRNEIIWCYKENDTATRYFSRKHDTIFFYAKGDNYTFNMQRGEITQAQLKRYQIEKDGERYANMKGKIRKLEGGARLRDWWDMPIAQSPERLGYPTQKPRALLERIIKASSNEGDIVMDCYCGCGTTIDAAHAFNRHWIGMDITYRAIALVQNRLNQYKNYKDIETKITGIPRDLSSARKLANSPDDYLRKEFEIWAILAFTNHAGIPNEKKGGDGGIDGRIFFATSPDKIERAGIEVKSGAINPAIIDRLFGGMSNIGAPIGYLLTLEKPTKGMQAQASSKGFYTHPLYPGRKIPKIQIITIEEILAGRTVDQTGIQPIATTTEGKPLGLPNEELF